MFFINWNIWKKEKNYLYPFFSNLVMTSPIYWNYCIFWKSLKSLKNKWKEKEKKMNQSTLNTIRFDHDVCSFSDSSFGSSICFSISEDWEVHFFCRFIFIYFIGNWPKNKTKSNFFPLRCNHHQGYLQPKQPSKHSCLT